MVRSTEVVADGAMASIVKRATGGDVAALRAEARRLEAVAHPGVVQILSSSGTDEHWELQLAHAGRTVDVVGALPVAQVAGVTAAVATTLADLHDAGAVHGRVDASHVLIGLHGRPVLCGFGEEPAGVGPADDVAALGALLVKLLGVGADMEPIPERRWVPRRSWSGWERRSLLLLADQACADPPTRRPTARRLAAAIADAVPGAVVAAHIDPTPGRLDEPARPTDPIEALRATALEDGSRTPPRLPVLAGAVVGVVVLGAGALGVVRTDQDVAAPPAPRVHEDPASVRPSALTSTTVLPPTTTSTTTVASMPPVPCIVLSGATATPRTCAQPVRVEGTTVVVGARRYEVGQPGDLVVLGDWDCDGGATPAVLRPSTGDVFVFTSWVATGEVAIGPTSHVANAVTAQVEARAGGCATLVVRRADGARVPVATERSA